MAISFINFDALLKGDSHGKEVFAGERDCFPSPSLFPRTPVTLKTPHIPLAPLFFKGAFSFVIADAFDGHHILSLRGFVKSRGNLIL